MDASEPHRDAETAPSPVAPTRSRLLTRELKSALFLIAASLAASMIALGLFAIGDLTGARENDVYMGVAVTAGVAAMVLGAACFVGTPLIALVSIVRSALSPAPFSIDSVKRFGITIGVVAAGLFSGVLTGGFFTRGRQVRVRGKVALAPTTAGESWLTREVEPRERRRDAAAWEAPVDAADPWPESPEERRGLADAWRENGRTEHASVAAFARLTLDLLTLGAPASLVAASQRDGVDESRHTELCFELARTIDGRAISPGAFARANDTDGLPRHRLAALAALAVDSLVDGALHEGVSAHVVAALAKESDVPSVRRVLREIAADEGRHAAHGWDVVVWCAEVGGEPVLAALRAAAASIPVGPAPARDAHVREGRYRRWGIPSHDLEAEAYRSMRADVVARVARLGVSDRAA